MARPTGIAIAADGAIIVADTANQVIRRIDRAGRIATIAGRGTRGDAASHVRNASALFREPTGVAVEEDGSVLVADAGNNAIRRIGLDGFTTTLVQDGLSDPTDIAALGTGQYAVADTGHNRVVVVSADGTMKPLAGTGQAGFSGDNGPASSARLRGPIGLSMSAAGLLIVDAGNRVVRRVNADGTIATVAGSAGGTSGGSGATGLQLTQPDGVTQTADGGFAVSDVGRVWAIAPDGNAHPIAGIGDPGFSGDEGAGISTRLDHPADLATAPDGAVMVADTNNDRVRRILASGRVVTVAGSDLPNVSLAPVVSAPFHSQTGGGEGTNRYRPHLHLRGRPLRVPQSAGGSASGGGQAPPCAVGSTRYNYLKIRPYTSRLIRSASRPVVIGFGTSADARVTGFAWRLGRRYGRHAHSFRAGPRRIRLGGSLRPGRYVAVVVGKNRQGLRRCDSRALRVTR